MHHRHNPRPLTGSDGINNADDEEKVVASRDDVNTEKIGGNFVSVAVAVSPPSSSRPRRASLNDDNITPSLDGVEDEGGENDEEDVAAASRSMMKDLWAEAGSSRDFSVAGGMLPYRRTTATARQKGSSPGGTKTRGGRGHGIARGVVTRGGRRRATRAEKIAKRVWLAAFAAFAASILITVHVYLYRALMSRSSDDGGGGVGAATGVSLTNDDPEPATMTMEEAKAHAVSPLTDAADRDRYTIRMNTWRRDEQLLLSLDHHASCDGVAQIQVVWCDAENDPPPEVSNHPSNKVVVERHDVNSLNERFRVLVDAPTLGILSLDDDILRPCAALDAGFVRWTRHPDRMVGFDIRSHVVVNAVDGKNDNDGDEGGSDNDKTAEWKYGYLSTTESSNRYSISLTRAAFLHRDYFDLYVSALPRSMYSYVARSFECEDVAMSFFVSALTGGRPPLVADYWAVKSMVKIYSPLTISGGRGHKAKRDRCVDAFATELGLKSGETRLRRASAMHQRNRYFGYGAEPEDWTEDVNADDPDVTPRVEGLIMRMRGMTNMDEGDLVDVFAKMKRAITGPVKGAGLIEKTELWKKRWQGEKEEKEADERKQ